MQHHKTLSILLLSGLFTASTARAQAVFQNPLGRNVTLFSLLTSIINWLLGISAVIAVLAIVVAGVRIIIHSMSGDEKALDSSKEVVKWAIIGLALIALSWVIVRTVPAILGITGI